MYISYNQSLEGIIFDFLSSIPLNHHNTRSCAKAVAHLNACKLHLCSLKIKNIKALYRVVVNIKAIVKAIICCDETNIKLLADEMREAVCNLAFDLLSCSVWVENNKKYFIGNRPKTYYAECFYNNCTIFQKILQKLLKEVCQNSYRNYSPLSLVTDKYKSGARVVPLDNWNFVWTQEDDDVQREFQIINAARQCLPNPQPSTSQQYEETNTLQIMANSVRECEICFVKKREVDFFRNLVCPHSFCKVCTIKAREDNLNCMACRILLPCHSFMELSGVPLQFVPVILNNETVQRNSPAISTVESTLSSSSSSSATTASVQTSPLLAALLQPTTVHLHTDAEFSLASGESSFAGGESFLAFGESSLANDESHRTVRDANESYDNDDTTNDESSNDEPPDYDDDDDDFMDLHV